MVIDEEYKEVLFNQYCKTCKNKDLDDSEEPCNECLDNPVNLYSQRPVKWEASK